MDFFAGSGTTLSVAEKLGGSGSGAIGEAFDLHHSKANAQYLPQSEKREE